jgi:hypothetical protein
LAKSEKLFFIKTMKEKTKLLPVLEERDLVIIVDNRREFSLHPLAAREWKRMKEKAKAEGVDLQIVSAFRSIARQAEIIEEKRKKGIQEAEIFRVSAPPVLASITPVGQSISTQRVMNHLKRILKTRRPLCGC